MGNAKHGAPDLSAALAEWQRRQSAADALPPVLAPLKEHCRLCMRGRWARWSPAKRIAHWRSIPHVAEVYGVFIWDLTRAVRAAQSVDGVRVRKPRRKRRGAWDRTLTQEEKIDRAAEMVARWEVRISAQEKILRKWKRRLKAARSKRGAIPVQVWAEENAVKETVR